MHKIDYKKEYKDLYSPKTVPTLINVPDIKYIMIDGKGDPNTSEEYKNAMEILYGLSFTIKMSKMSSYKINGYFEYVVPPLEGLWTLDKNPIEGFIKDKSKLTWTSMIRQPEFVTKEVFNWACEELKKKKPNIDLSKVRFEKYDEGLCVQIMHIGSYDDEARSIKLINEFMDKNGYKNAINDKTKKNLTRHHHEIYLGDPRRTKVENLKTVIRIPVK